MEIPINMDDLGVPLFSETPIYSMASAELQLVAQISLSILENAHPGCSKISFFQQLIFRFPPCEIFWGLHNYNSYSYTP